MKAQDYVDKHLPKIKEAKNEEELDSIVHTVFLEFNDEVLEIAKLRNARRDTAMISIIKEIGQKWGKFCRIINQQQDLIQFKEDGFLLHWKKTLNF